MVINKYFQIHDGIFSVNGIPVWKSAEKDVKSLLSSYYRTRNIDYAKFFKMDNLAKAGFLAAEELLPDNREGDHTGLFFANSYSSLDTDIHYQATIGDEYYPSPSIFVYTLANIVLGEICIRYKIYGENIFLIGEDIFSSRVLEYATHAFNEDRLHRALIGWLNVCQDECDVFAMMVTQEGKGWEMTIENVKQLLEK